MSKAPNVINLAQESESGEALDPSETTECFDLFSVGRRASGLFKLGVECPELRLDILQILKLNGKSRLKGSLEGLPELPEPEEMLLCPSGLGSGKDMAMLAQSAGDAVLGGG